MANIDRIKPNQCGEKPPICLGDIIAKKITVFAQTRLDPVKRVKQIRYRLIISRCLCRKSSAIDAIIDMLINIIIDRLDGGAACRWPEIQPIAGNRIKCRIEYANNF